MLAYFLEAFFGPVPARILALNPLRAYCRSFSVGVNFRLNSLERFAFLLILICHIQYFDPSFAGDEWILKWFRVYF